MNKNLISLALALSLTACGGSDDATPVEVIVDNNIAAEVVGETIVSLDSETTTISGELTITDENAGEAAFVVQDNEGTNYGTFTIAAKGAWTYVLDTENADVMALLISETLTDIVLITALDGTITELEVTFAGTAAIPTSCEATPTNLTIVGATATVFDEAKGKVPSNAVDGDIGTVWAGPATAATDTDPVIGAALTFKLDDISNITSLELLWSDSDKRSVSYQVETSKINSDVDADWTTVLATADAEVNAADAYESVVLTESVAEYVRITGYGYTKTEAEGGSSSVWNTLIEAKATGCATEETSTATNTPATLGGDIIGAMDNDETSVTGTISILDIDGDAIKAQTGATGTGGYGAFSIDTAGAWTYTPSDITAVTDLEVGKTLTDTFTVMSDEDPAVSTTVTITITGAAEDVVVVPGDFPATVDEFNFTAGSYANTGTASDVVGAIKPTGNPTISFVEGAIGDAGNALQLVQAYTDDSTENDAVGYVYYSAETGSGLEQITGSFSTEVVIKSAPYGDYSSDVAFIDYADTSSDVGFKTYMGKSDRMVTFKVYNGTDDESVKSTGALIDDTWYHIVSVYDATASTFGTITLYIDGVAVNTKDLSALPVAPKVGDKAIFAGGSGKDNKNLNGSVDNIATWNDALTPAQVLERKALFTAGTPATPNLKLASIVDVITDITNPGDEAAGVLRYKRDYADVLEQGKVTVTVRNNATDQDAFFMLYGSSTSSSDALLDLRIKKDGAFEIRGNDGTVTLNDVTQGAWLDIDVTWDSSSDTDFATINLTIVDKTDDSEQSVSFTSFTGVSDGDIKDDDTAAGLTTIQQIDYVRTVNFKLASDDASANGSFEVDDIKVYSDTAGTTEVFSADFEDDLYVVGDDLESDTDPSPFDGSTIQATVADGPDAP